MAVGAVVFLGLGLVEAWQDAPTYDEPVYTASGIAAVLHHDLTLNAEHPPLSKVVAVLPVLADHPVVPPNGTWSNDQPPNRQWSYGAAFLDAQRRAGTLQTVIFLSRLVPLLEVVGLAFVLFLLARDLFGRWAGAVAGLLWLLSPFVLGLGHLNSMDASFALVVTTWSWVLLRWIRAPGPGRLVWLGVLSGAALLTEMTGLLLVGLAAGVVAVSGWRASPRRALGRAGLVVLTAWGALWLVYTALDRRVLLHPAGIVPYPYWRGLVTLARWDSMPSPGYLFGVSWTGARWWYWPGALVVKTVPTTVLVLVAGPLSWIALDRSTRRQAATVLALPGLTLVAFTLWFPRDLGLRYWLPVLALWLVAASAVVRLGRPAVTAGVVAAIGVAGVLTVTSVPDSVSWTAPPFRPGDQVATNSDVDWGQDYYRLERWSVGRHPWIDYFGPPGLGAASIPGGRPLSGADPRRVTGWVAVSATELTGVAPSPVAWLRAYCSVGELGGSILVYRFTRPPSRVTGPVRPAGPCPAGRRGPSGVSQLASASGQPAPAPTG